MAKRGRPQELEIRSEAVQELLDFNEMEKLAELSVLTGIKVPTLHSWAQNDATPLNSINLCLKLLKTGKSLEELKEMFERAAENAKAEDDELTSAAL